MTTKLQRVQALALAKHIAELTNEAESAQGFAWEDAALTLNRLIHEAREITGFRGYRVVYCVDCQCPRGDCNCELPGDCRTCATLCSSEGICPICSTLEDARTKREIAKALAQPLDACRKCGAPLCLGDVHNGTACVDLGEREEDGRVFIYCSFTCRETH